MPIALKKAPKSITKKPSIWGRTGNSLSRLGKALMFPIAMLPIAAILMRIGAAIPTTTEFSTFMSNFIGSGGNAVFNNLSILFAIGLAFGLSKDSRGEAAIVGFVCMEILVILMSSGAGHADLVQLFYGKLHLGHPVHPGDYVPNGFAGVFNTYGKFDPSAATQVPTHGSYDAILATNVLNGIIVGCIVAYIYNNFKGTEMPQVLGFFSGRRTVPIIATLTTMVFVLLWAVIFPWIGYGIYELSNALGQAQGNRYANAAIMFVYGIINRLLIPFGLHNVPNTLFWFTFGEFPKTGGGTAYGDINIFISGATSYMKDGHKIANPGGTFQSGFFPIFMFGLPALVYAIYKNADKPERMKVIGLLGGAAFVSFFTGITEPIEYAFLYVAPFLFLIHAFLTGLFGFIVGLFGIQIGFAFSAGFIDFVLSIPKSLAIIHDNYIGIDAIMRNPFWLLPIGIVTAFTYYYVSSWAIKKFNIATPGRAGNYIVIDNGTKMKDVAEGETIHTSSAQKIIQGVGGPKNIDQIEWCATRLRFMLNDRSKVNNKLLKYGGSRGEINIGNNGFQVIIGPKVEMMGEAINSILAGKVKYKPISDESKLTQLITKPKPKAKKLPLVKVMSPITGKVIPLEKVKDEAFSSGGIGKGIAIVPTNGVVVAPFDGKVTVAFPTHHAYVIEAKGAGDTAVLIHIGIDTIKLKGESFKPFIKQGDSVKAGDKIVQIDVKALTAKKIDITTMVIVPNDDHERKVTLIAKPGPITKGKDLFTIN